MNLNQLYALFQGLTTLYILYLVFPLSSLNIYSPFSPEPKFPSPSPPVYPTTYPHHDSVFDDADIWLDFNPAQMKPDTASIQESVIDPGLLGFSIAAVSRVFPLFGSQEDATPSYDDLYKPSPHPFDADSEVRRNGLSKSTVFTTIAIFFGLLTGAAILVVPRRDRERHDMPTTLDSREPLHLTHYQIHALAETSVDLTQSNIPWIFGRSDSESPQVVSKFATPSPLAAVPCEAYSSPSKRAAILSQNPTTLVPQPQAGLINSSLLSVVDGTFDSDFPGTSSDTLVTDLSPQRPMFKGTFAQAVSSTHEDALESLNIHLTAIAPVTYSQDQDILLPVHDIGTNEDTFDIERHFPPPVCELYSDEEESTRPSVAAPLTEQLSNLRDCEKTFSNCPSNPATHSQDQDVHDTGTNENTSDIEKRLPSRSVPSDSEETLSNGPPNREADSLAIRCKTEIAAEAPEFQVASSITNLADPLPNLFDQARAVDIRTGKFLEDAENLFFNLEEIQASSFLAEIADPSSGSLPWVQSRSQGKSRKGLRVAPSVVSSDLAEVKVISSVGMAELEEPSPEPSPLIRQEYVPGKGATEFLAALEHEDFVFDPQEFQANSSLADIADTSSEPLPWIQPESKGNFPKDLPAGPSIFVFNPDEFYPTSALVGMAEHEDHFSDQSPSIQQECASGKGAAKFLAASKPEALVFDPQEFQASSSLADIADTSSESLPWLQPELKPNLPAGPSNVIFDTDEFQATSSLVGMAELAGTSPDPSPLIQQECVPGKGAAELFAASEPEDLVFDPQEFQASSSLVDITDTSSESFPWLQPELKRNSLEDHRASSSNFIFDADEFQATSSLVGIAEFADPSPESSSPIQQECAPETVPGKFCAASEDLVFDPPEFQASSSLADFADSSSDSLPWLLPESNDKVLKNVRSNHFASSPSLKLDAQEFHIVTSLVGIPELEDSSPGFSPMFEQKPSREKDFEKFLADPELIFDPGEFQASSSLIDIADSSSESLPWFRREYETGKVPKDVFADPFLTSSNPIFDPDEFQATSSLVNLADLATSPANPVHHGNSSKREFTVRSTSRSGKSPENFLFNSAASVRGPSKLDPARPGNNSIRRHAGPPNFPLEDAFNFNEIMTIKRLVNHAKLSPSNSNPSLTRRHEHPGFTGADVSNEFDIQESPTPKERSKTLRRSVSLGCERLRNDYKLPITSDSDITHHHLDDNSHNLSRSRHSQHRYPQQPHISPVREPPISLEWRRSTASAPTSPRDPAFWRKFRRVTSFKAQPLGELLHIRK